ncbi:hypothetical protein MPER_10690, partial [Moniliophthora perniciosa FA553]
MDIDEFEESLEAQPAVEKRFKELKDVHLPSALSGKSKLDQELEDTQSHFYEALIHWQQLNLSPSYVKFAQKAGPISASLPLLLHNWKEIVGLWVEALDSSDDEGLKALLELFKPPSTPCDAHNITRIPHDITFHVVYSVQVPPYPINGTEITRTVVVDPEVWGNVLRKLKAALKERAVVIIAEDLDGIEDAAAWCFVSKEFSSSSSTDEERLGRLLELAAIPTSVRNGTRLSAGHLTQLYTEVTKIPLPLPSPLRAAFLRLLSSLLTAGDMSAWISSGRALLTHLWGSDEMAEFTLQLHGILADLSWGGWKMIALPVL